MLCIKVKDISLSNAGMSVMRYLLKFRLVLGVGRCSTSEYCFFCLCYSVEEIDCQGPVIGLIAVTQWFMKIIKHAFHWQEFLVSMMSLLSSASMLLLAFFQSEMLNNKKFINVKPLLKQGVKVHWGIASEEALIYSKVHRRVNILDCSPEFILGCFKNLQRHF